MRFRDKGGALATDTEIKVFISHSSEDTALAKLLIDLLRSARTQCRFNQKKTADFLGMTYHQLRGYLRKYELTDEDN